MKKLNNCKNINLFYFKVKSLRAKFEEMRGEGDFDEAKEIQKKIKPILEKATKLSDYLLPSVVAKKHGFLSVGPFNDGVAIAQTATERTSLIDREGNAIIGVVSSVTGGINPSGNGGYIVNSSFSYRLVDSKGKPLGDGIYEDIVPFSEGFCVAVKNNQAFFLNERGEKVFDKEGYRNAFPFNEGVAIIRNENEPNFNLIDKNGDLIMYLRADLTSGFSEGLVGIVDPFCGGDWVYYDLNKNMKIRVLLPMSKMCNYAHAFLMGSPAWIYYGAVVTQKFLDTLIMMAIRSKNSKIMNTLQTLFMAWLG